jgi:hypothetical protein
METIVHHAGHSRSRKTCRQARPDQAETRSGRRPAPHGATTAGTHRFAVFLIVVAVLLLGLVLADRSPTRIHQSRPGGRR